MHFFIGKRKNSNGFLISKFRKYFDISLRGAQMHERFVIQERLKTENLIRETKEAA